MWYRYLGFYYVYEKDGRRRMNCTLRRKLPNIITTNYQILAFSFGLN